MRYVLFAIYHKFRVIRYLISWQILKGNCHFFNPLFLLIRWKALIETKIKQKNASKNIQPFSSYSGLNFLLFSIVILLCHSHSWIIKEGIFYFQNEYNIWIPRAKSVRNVKFCRSNSIISKIMRPSFLQFSVRKDTSVWNCVKYDFTFDKNGNFKPE